MKREVEILEQKRRVDRGSKCFLAIVKRAKKLKLKAKEKLNEIKS